MTFTLSTKSRRVCAHPTSPFPDPAHSALLLDSCLVPHLSRHSPSRRWAVRTAEVSPRRRRRLQTVAAGGGASAAATARAAADMRPCRRRAWGAGGERARGAPTPLLSSTPPILLLRILLGCCARRLDRRGSSRGGGSGGGGGALGAAPLGSEGAGGAQPRRAARRAAAPKAQRRPAAVAWRDACPPPVCWYHRAWHAATAPARCGSGLRDVGPRRGRRSCRRPSGGWAAGSLPLSSAGGHRGGRSGAARGPAESAAREASCGPSPSAGTVSGAAAGCPAPLAPGRRPAAAREGWIGRRDGRQSLVRLAGIPVYALKGTTFLLPRQSHENPTT